MLRVIGYWQSDQQPAYPDPRDRIDPGWDSDVRNWIASYLRRGVVARAFMGYSPCRLCDKRDNGSLELSDGIYVWPEGLAHYVEDHAVRLPEEFVEHAFATEERLSAANRDMTWWVGSD